MAIHESAENYLETILMLSKERPVVRAVDIANELDFKKSSVSIAMKNFKRGESHHGHKRRLHLPDRIRSENRRNHL